MLGVRGAHLSDGQMNSSCSDAIFAVLGLSFTDGKLSPIRCHLLATQQMLTDVFLLLFALTRYMFSILLTYLCWENLKTCLATVGGLVTDA